MEARGWDNNVSAVMRCVKFAVHSLISAGKLDTAIVLLPFEFVKGWIYRSVMAKKRKPLNANEVVSCL